MFPLRTRTRTRTRSAATTRATARRRAAPPSAPLHRLTPACELVCLPKFLTPTECAALLRHTEFVRSRTVDATTTDSRAVHHSRTSTCTTLPSDDQRTFATVVARQLPTLYHTHDREPTQLARYTTGQRYDYHHDYFAADALASDTPNSPSRQRTYTLLVYLNTVPEANGGATHFPTLGVRVQPVAGTAILWNNLDKHGAPNEATLHAGLPMVGDATKTIATQWFLTRDG